MFKDKYKRACDVVEMTEQDKTRVKNGFSRGRKRNTWIAPVAVAACICLLVTGIWASTLNRSGVLTPGQKAYKVQTAQSYSEIYARISELQSANNYDGLYKNGIAVDDAVPRQETESASAPAATGAPTYGADASTDDYSKTNVQVEGVDESDIIKTDGKYIYVMHGDTEKGITIFRASGDKTAFVTRLDYAKNTNDTFYRANGMYLYDDMLIIITYRSKITYKYTIDGLYYGCFWYACAADGETHILTYDVKDPEKPSLISDVTQDGFYNESRLTGGVLYTVTCYGLNMWDGAIDEKDAGTFIPCVGDKNGKTLVPADKVVMLENVEEAHYIVASAIDMKAPDTVKSDLAILGTVNGLFASADNLLLYNTRWDYNEYKAEVNEDGEIVALSDSSETDIFASETGRSTDLYLVSMNAGDIEFVTNTNMRGWIDDQFSIDEYKGYFRIVANIDENRTVFRRLYNEEGMPDGDSFEAGRPNENLTFNNLYIYNQQLEEVGKIENIAENEYIKSARFMGDIGYFVTFRQTDPLFSVDLKDPTNPKIISKLKIPGFSEYLQGYGEGLLLGIGFDADVNEGGTTGVKLSMFDVSDPKNVKEVAKLTLDEQWSSAVNNHKAILADPDKNLIGFSCESSYLVFSFENGEFTQRAEIKPQTNWSYDIRGLYIGSYYYVADVENLTLTVLDMTEFAEIAVVDAAN